MFPLHLLGYAHSSLSVIDYHIREEKESVFHGKLVNDLFIKVLKLCHKLWVNLEKFTGRKFSQLIVGKRIEQIRQFMS